MDSTALAQELAAIRTLRVEGGELNQQKVLEHCLEFAHDEFPPTDDPEWHELAIHQAWALTQPGMNAHRVMGLFTYVIDNTPLGTLTVPYVAAMCMRAALFLALGETARAHTIFEHVLAKIKDASDPAYLDMYYATLAALGIAPQPTPND